MIAIIRVISCKNLLLLINSFRFVYKLDCNTDNVTRDTRYNPEVIIYCENIELIIFK